jgi:hypothetical protein
MPFMLARFDVGNFDEWKPFFDEDPVGRSEKGKGHTMMRAVDNPNEVMIALEFGSVDDAKEFREKLLASGALDRVTVLAGPTVAEEFESVTY